MIPTGRLVLLLVLPTILAGAVVLWEDVWTAVMALDAILAVVVLVDALRAGGNVTATRDVRLIQSVGRAFPVGLTLRSDAPVVLRVQDAPPGEPEGLPLAATLAADTPLRLDYRTRVASRGLHHFGPLTVRMRSPWGLWERQRTLEVADEVRVHPDLSELRRGRLTSRADERPIPTRARRRPGGESEFQRLRPYLPGDPYRHVDWRGTARSGRLVVREFGQEANQNVLFLLDCGRTMTGELGDLAAFDHALDAMLAFADTALRRGDRVGLLAYDREVRVWLPPVGGPRSGARLMRATYDLFPRIEETDHAAAFLELARRVRRRSLVVLLTSVVDEAAESLVDGLVRGLAQRHLPLCVWLRDPEIQELAEARPEGADDVYVTAAAAEAVAWREQALSKLRRRGALVVDCEPSELTGELISRYLEIKARKLL